MPDGISLPYNGTGAAQVLLSHFEPTLEQCTPAISSVNGCRTTGCWTTDGTDPTINWGCKEIGIGHYHQRPKNFKILFALRQLTKVFRNPFRSNLGLPFALYPSVNGVTVRNIG
jgi:hypothetical protein